MSQPITLAPLIGLSKIISAIEADSTLTPYQQDIRIGLQFHNHATVLRLQAIGVLDLPAEPKAQEVKR